MFAVKDAVKKVSGYQYFGIVVSVFNTLKGDERFVVDSTSEGSKGMLFIFNATQLELDN